MADISYLARSAAGEPPVSRFRGWNMTGWWLTISCAPLLCASSATSDVMSRAVMTFVTSVSGLPTMSPLLSQLSCVEKGASSSILR